MIPTPPAAVTGRLRLLAGALAALLLVGLAAHVLVVVDHGEEALVFRLGAVHRQVGPGLSVRLPWPLETVRVVDVSNVRRIEPGTRRLLTGDTNLVDLGLVVQYTVGDPRAFLVDQADPDAVVEAAVLSEAVHAVSGMGVDELLTTGRADLQERVRHGAQEELDRLGAGVRLVGVEVASLAPPPAVVDAFNDVSSARGDRETLALAAEGYASRVLPEARGRAASIVEQARSDASLRLARAQGDVGRWRALRAAATSREAERARLLAAVRERVFGRVSVQVVVPGAEVAVPLAPPGASPAPRPPAAASPAGNAP